MKTTTMDDEILIVKPEPDSQFRLKPCRCGSDNVAFAQYSADGTEPWRVRCFDCGYTVDRVQHMRHGAQLAWNVAIGWA